MPRRRGIASAPRLMSDAATDRSSWNAAVPARGQSVPNEMGLSSGPWPGSGSAPASAPGPRSCSATRSPSGPGSWPPSGSVGAAPDPGSPTSCAGEGSGRSVGGTGQPLPSRATGDPGGEGLDGRGVGPRLGRSELRGGMVGPKERSWQARSAGRSEPVQGAGGRVHHIYTGCLVLICASLRP